MSDQPTYEDFREEMVARFPNTVLVAEVAQPSPNPPRTYGPFINGEHAMKWLLTVPMGVRVRFAPLRTPNVQRTYDDFYAPDKMLNAEREFTQITTKEETNGQGQTENS